MTPWDNTCLGMASGMMRRVRWNVPRTFLGLLLIMYGYLFVVLHQLEPQLSSSNVVRVPNPFAGVHKEILQSNATATLYPVPSHWNHGLWDVHHNIAEYSDDLWDHAHLPSWMKGESNIIFCHVSHVMSSSTSP